jgi:hypothetical protein
MTLQPPKKNGSCYELVITPPVAAPRLSCKSGEWIPNADWITWATEERQKRIGELLSHGGWFSRPPRREVLEPLFAPWTGKVNGTPQIFCNKPDAVAGSAVWNLVGLTMTSAAIAPIWRLSDIQEEASDTISLFGDAESADDEEREIQFDDIAAASPEAPPTRMRNREWDAAKFMAKERVCEFRLKAQIADHLARKEEARFYAKYGDLEETESRFSDYDLSDAEDKPSDSPETP